MELELSCLANQAIAWPARAWPVASRGRGGQPSRKGRRILASTVLSTEYGYLYRYYTSTVLVPQALYLFADNETGSTSTCTGTGSRAYNCRYFADSKPYNIPVGTQTFGFATTGTVLIPVSLTVTVTLV